MPLGSRCRVIPEDFPDAENSRSCREESPINRANMPGSVDTQTVNAIFFDEESNPIIIRIDDGVVFNVDIYHGNHVLLPSSIAAH